MAAVHCPTCGWEFAIDSEDQVVDDGEAEPEAELEIDAEGELVATGPNEETFPPWHGIASVLGRSRDRGGWHEDAAEDEEPYPEETDGVLVGCIDSTVCPNCRHIIKGIWIGEVCCPGCDWLFRVDCDGPDDLDGEGVGDYEFADPRSVVAQGVPPLMVAPAGHETCTTIGEAVRRAEPGRRILVCPGLYEEEIVVRTPIEILGHGPREQIILQGLRGPCLSMLHSKAVVRGLTLRGRGRREKRKPPAVELEFGLIEDCAITSASATCVKLRGGSLRRCRIHDGEQTGIVATAGSVEDCEILHNGGPGVLVERDGSALLRRCRVHDGHAEGVVISPGGHATLVDCDIHANARAGVVIGGERTLLWKCRIHDGAATGIRIADGGVGFVEHCAIFGNAGPGLRVTGGSVYAWRSRLHDGKSIGVAISGRGVVDLRRCAIYHHVGAGVAMGPDVRPIVRRCRIRANHRARRE
jgi:hypothetical protein